MWFLALQRLLPAWLFTSVASEKKSLFMLCSSQGLNNSFILFSAASAVNLKVLYCHFSATTALNIILHHDMIHESVIKITEDDFAQGESGKEMEFYFEGFQQCDSRVSQWKEKHQLPFCLSPLHSSQVMFVCRPVKMCDVKFAENEPHRFAQALTVEEDQLGVKSLWQENEICRGKQTSGRVLLSSVSSPQSRVQVASPPLVIPAVYSSAAT